MVELKSFPFDSIADDREYPAQIFRNYFHKFLSTGVYFGKYREYGDYSMKVVPSLELNIRVTKGAGLIRGLDFELEEDAVLPINLSLGKIRKDMVVVKADDTLAERKTSLYIKEGTDTAFAQLERTSDIYEICLAKITVGDTKITVDLDDIEDTRRDAELAGIVTSLIDIDIQDVLDDITLKKNNFFETLGITTKTQAEQLITDLETYCEGKEVEADGFIDRLQEMLQELQDDMIPAELVTINNSNYTSTTLDGILTEIFQKNTNLQNNKADKQELNTELSKKSDIPTSKTLTLATANWVQNETTQKYEYTIEDTSITEKDYVLVDILDKDQEEIMANVQVDTANGSIKFTSEEQIDINVELQVVIMRTKAEEVEQEVEA